MHRSSAHEAWLPCWGFVEITTKPEGFGVRDLMTRVRPRRATAFHLLDKDHRKFTIVFDPGTERCWSRLGHATMLDETPFHLGLSWRTFKLADSFSDDFLPYDKKYRKREP